MGSLLHIIDWGNLEKCTLYCYLDSFFSECLCPALHRHRVAGVQPEIICKESRGLL